MVDIYAAQFSRGHDDFGHGNNREIEIGFTTENDRDGNRFYRSNLDANYWQRQNDVLVQNGTLPMTEIGQQSDRYHRPGRNMGHDGRCMHGGRGYAYGGVDNQYNMRDRPSDFDDGYASSGRYSDVQGQNMRYREQYMRDFRSRQAEAIERAYEQKYNRFHNGYRGGSTREMGAPDGPNVPSEVAPQPGSDSRQQNPQQDTRLYHNDLPPTPPGYVDAKWNDPNHLTTKYVVGRAVDADLLPALRNVPEKADRADIAEQYWRQNRNLIERDGSTIMGFNGEKLLIRDQQGKVFLADTVVSLGVQDQMRPGWEIIDDPRKINVNDFRP